MALRRPAEMRPTVAMTRRMAASARPREGWAKGASGTTTMKMDWTEASGEKADKVWPRPLKTKAKGAEIVNNPL